MKSKTLLQVAKESKSARLDPDNPLRRERIELALAYVRGEVTGAQAGEALGTSRTNACTSLALTLVSAIKRGQLRIEVAK